MNLEWDEAKAASNLRKHGISFDEAEALFEGETISFVDDRVDYTEQRLVTLGPVKGRLLLVVSTQRGSATRVISLRKANAREQRIYQDRLGKG